MDRTIPQSVVMVIPFDHQNRVLFHHRSENVRSAPNCWSFPSGMQEHGELILAAAARELLEETGLIAERLKVVGRYDNLTSDGWHWAITVVVCLVDDVTEAINREPDKHDQTMVASMMELTSLRFWMVYSFSPAFDEWARNNCMRLVYDMLELKR